MESKVISILHISDIHKSKNWDINNQNLISALHNDFERYSNEESPKIKKPDLIILSGDIIYGNIEKDRTTAEDSFKKEYADSLDFINCLTKQFLEGNKEKLIIIPGNHDVSWFQSYSSMKKIDIDNDSEHDKNKNALLKQFRANNNLKIRWSWKEHSYYEIADEEIYNNRFKAYSEFYKEFYGTREFSLIPAKQFDLFDFPDWGITVVTFNSCFRNDHLNLEGKINPDCIANASTVIRQYKNKGRLLIAVWHHNTKGLPNEANYMDSRIIKSLIDHGFSLGFHGHQHKSEIIDDYFRYGENKKMTVISAGTLCGGPDQLPSGEKRQYNIVEINLKKFKGTLHSREMMNTSSFELPTWGAGHVLEGINKSFVEFDIQPPLKNQSSDKSFLEAVDLLKNNEPEKSIELLRMLDLEDLKTREILIECYVKLNNNDAIIKHFNSPKTEVEAIYLLDALKAVGDKTRLKSTLDLSIIKNSNDPSLKVVRDKYLKL